jgi:hypothetical protein
MLQSKAKANLKDMHNDIAMDPFAGDSRACGAPLIFESVDWRAREQA